MIEVCEIFASLSGEGAWTGWPAVFVRLSGCNLRCKWCDTAYARQAGTTYRMSDLLAEVDGFGLPRVVVTGGEPLLQKQTPRLLERLLSRQYKAALETNGSLPLDAVPQGVHIVMDLKPPSSGHADANLWQNLGRLDVHDELKVVIACRSDLDWLMRTLNAHRDEIACRVSVQPAYGRLSAVRLADWVLAGKLPVRFGIQLHKHLWGRDTRR